MERGFERIYGCLIGGAIGDAISAPVKYMSYQAILDIYGEHGVVGFTYSENSHEAVVTDDTQLTLFTAEGLLRSIVRARKKGVELDQKDTTTSVFRAYIRWLYTQGLTTPNWRVENYDGWLVKVKKMHAYREPGITCITSLGKGVMGRLERPINNSKKSGTVIRSAPVGLIESPNEAFEKGLHIAAITHGHPSAYLSAGAFSMIIACIMEGKTLLESIELTIKRLKKEKDSIECVESIEQALELAKEKELTPDKIKSLGKGFDAHEALAISVYCVLNYEDDFLGAVLAATNHSGDSDATASMVGNIMGAYIGASGIDEDLKEAIELKSEIKTISEDLVTYFRDDEAWARKYPAW